MGYIDSNTLRDWNDGDVVTSALYEQEREILRTAINDNFARLVKSFTVLNPDGTTKTTKNFDTAFNFLKLKEGSNVQLALDTSTGVLTISAVPATGSISTPMIADGAIITVKLADGSVTTAKIANGAITESKMAPDSVNTSAIKAGAIDNSKLANASVTGTKISNNAIGTAHLVDGSVTQSKIADGAVGTSQLANGAVTSSKIANGAVGSSAIMDGSVGTSKLADGSVTAQKMAVNSVGTANIQDGSITNSKLTPNSVGTTNIQDGSVTESKIAVGALDNRYFTEAELQSTTPGSSGAEKIGSAPIYGVSGTTVYAQLVDLKAQVNDVVSGVIPDGSITPEKLSFDPATQAELDAHAADNVRHITSTERTNWNAAKATADAALPKAGGTMTGPLKVDGNGGISAFNWLTMSSAGGGEAVLSDNAYIDKDTNQLKYKNTHPSLGARGIIFEWGSPGAPKYFDTGNVATTANQVFTPTMRKMWHEGNLNPDTFFKRNANKTVIDISGTNLNTFTDTGFYNGANLGGAPTTNWYYVEIFNHTNQNGYCLQRLTPLNSDEPPIYRVQKASAWGEWRPMASSPYQTIISQESKYSGQGLDVYTTILNITGSGIIHRVIAGVNNSSNTNACILKITVDGAVKFHGRAVSEGSYRATGIAQENEQISYLFVRVASEGFNINKNAIREYPFVGSAIQAFCFITHPIVFKSSFKVEVSGNSSVYYSIGGAMQ